MENVIDIKMKDIFRNARRDQTATYHLGMDYRRERTSKALDEIQETNKRRNNRSIERTHGQERQTDGQTNKQTNDRTHERTNERTSKRGSDKQTNK